ncbi:MauE/DoxX family redox-associated membrane protein [Chitinophaga pinensis]|uniref:Methylamine utilisation protein MauE domain-containing protein n=1 Tax=Chitinophaga pinensis (strain ATCC 43595 / DSM 2588 / LMG 13176 / NBRC 15968 / NCIMB 11800 / UQM 2034) TaxID=485918 RepID=A0A979GUV9_CHIPD|nr:MauE/DoxX family redox-associated membrane protein [Chitinophaga pinensis]ACU60636.1 hypothetical protein Cpin_3169 [Chitinophaga pinensis DSM 2588]
MKTKLVKLITSLLVLLFVYAGLIKLFDHANFELQLAKSPFMLGMSSLVSWLLPLSELAVVGLLLFEKTRLIALYCSFFMMVLFTAYIIGILNFSYYIPCSCGGVLNSLGWNEHLIFNAFFVIISLIGIILQKRLNIEGLRPATPQFG